MCVSDVCGGEQGARYISIQCLVSAVDPGSVQFDPSFGHLHPDSLLVLADHHDDHRRQLRRHVYANQRDDRVQRVSWPPMPRQDR